MDHVSKARDYFLEGYNCAQAVLAAFSDLTGLDETTSLKLASSLGGGIGGTRGTCGAVNAAAIVLGLTEGYMTPDDPQAKKDHYARVKSLIDDFTAEYGTVICRELLAGLKFSSTPSERTPEYYKTRPCARIVETAAALLEKQLSPNE